MSLYLGSNLISGVATPVEGARNIGQIVQSTIPLTDAGLHLLDGSLISSGSYADFVTYIAGLVSVYPDLFTTEANWQTAVSTYGVCGKFVYDSTNQTVRLPKYGDKIYTSGIASTAEVKGTGIALGITDTRNNYGLQGSNYAAFGGRTGSYGIAAGSTNTSGTWSPTDTAFGVTTDGAKSGIIADLSTITTALDGYWYIVIATSVKTQIEVDIDEIATDLNGKADVDLTNCTKPHIVETYENGTSGYIVYSNGYCEQWGQTPVAQATNVTFIKPYIQAPTVSATVTYSYYGTGCYVLTNGIGTTGFYVASGAWGDDGLLRSAYAESQKGWRAYGYIR